MPLPLMTLGSPFFAESTKIFSKNKNLHVFSLKMAILKRNEDKMKCDGQKCSMESVEENSSIGERYLRVKFLKA